MPFGGVGQDVFRDLALMLLEGRDMRIAEHRQAIGSHLDTFGDRIEA